MSILVDLHDMPSSSLNRRFVGSAKLESWRGNSSAHFSLNASCAYSSTRILNFLSLMMHWNGKVGDKYESDTDNA